MLPALLLLSTLSLVKAYGYCKPSDATCQIIGDPWVYTFQSTLYEFSKPGWFYAIESDEMTIQVEVVKGKSVAGNTVYVVDKLTYICDPDNSEGKYTKKTVTADKIDEAKTFSCVGVGSCKRRGDCYVSVVEAYDPIHSLAITGIRYTGSHSYGGLCYDNECGTKRTKTSKATKTTKTTTTTTTTTTKPTTTTTTTTTTTKPTTTTTTTTTTAKPTTTTTTTTTTQATTKAAENTTTKGETTTTQAVTTTTKYVPAPNTPDATTTAATTTTKYAPAGNTAETTTKAATTSKYAPAENTPDVTTTSTFKYAPAGNTADAATTTTTAKYAPAGNAPETTTGAAYAGKPAATTANGSATYVPAGSKPNLYQSSAVQVMSTIALTVVAGFLAL
ncbi:hypothetical protein BDR26DRAFT_857888 [Obelidium mucronatum]|nr:hypothetical protein BDR26DRAFT_857888 [Obelidium mucronatum]